MQRAGRTLETAHIAGEKLKLENHTTNVSAKNEMTSATPPPPTATHTHTHTQGQQQQPLQQPHQKHNKYKLKLWP
jgi:hypothetical protein